MNSVKKCISLPEETFDQLEWIRAHVLHAPTSIPLSQLIQMSISIAYFHELKKFAEKK